MTTAPCPVCGRRVPPDAAARRHAPFCTPRCADVDLGRWFTGHYRIPVEGEENDAGEVDHSDTSG